MTEQARMDGKADCLSDRCWSPVACGGFGYCRLRNFTPDNRPDNTGLDDGPPLPRATINGRKKSEAITLVKNGATLRETAEAIGVSHETIRVWTDGISKRRHAAQPKP